MGSTPIDFAYSIHSAVGNTMISAKVNGRMVPIDYTIQNGDRIEIITSQNSRGPSRDWLALVKSTQAKNKINQWFRSTYKEENIAKGREMILESAKSQGIDFGQINKPKYQEKVIRKYGFHDWNAVLAAVGQGSLKEGTVINRMNNAYLKEHPLEVTDRDVLEEVEVRRENGRHKDIPKSKSGIIVQGLYDVSVRLSKCCNPVPGDEIVGFVTRGRGVTVHRTDCINIINLPLVDQDRLIEAEWQPQMLEATNGSLFSAEIHIYGHNRTGLLVDISKIFSERNIDIVAIHSRTNRQGVATIDVSFGVSSRRELGHLIDRIRKVESVIDIERATG